MVAMERDRLRWHSWKRRLCLPCQLHLPLRPYLLLISLCPRITLNLNWACILCWPIPWSTDLVRCSKIWHAERFSSCIPLFLSLSLSLSLSYSLTYSLTCFYRSDHCLVRDLKVACIEFADFFCHQLENMHRYDILAHIKYSAKLALL